MSLSTSQVVKDVYVIIRIVRTQTTCNDRLSIKHRSASKLDFDTGSIRKHCIFPVCPLKTVESSIRMASEVEETMKRIQSHKGVVGTIVVNSEGIPIKTTMDNTTTVQYAGLISQLSDKARSVVRDLDPTNDLTFLRIRSRKHEIMVAPGKDTTWESSITPLIRMNLDRKLSGYAENPDNWIFL
ncbi:hypothetical protein Cfor_01891 [Coptotermes formosanus]|uniref:Roadblock/LAMTOR2 domain-containing protein n=1 Tax=Coptotermes formosanus TaxID=36987 RepID=A0A6L2Q2T2_COPFO|nr:hypothetical protein Cfor_01891 [Coptotermes formosanus]